MSAISARVLDFLGSEKRVGTMRYSDIRTRSIVAGLMLVPIVVSFFFLMHESLRLDEAQSLWQSSRSFGGVLYIVAQDVHVPLYQELLHVWRYILGTSVESARLLSLLFYVLTIPVIYTLARYCYDDVVGLWSAALFAFSPFMNWYGNEIRMYSLFVLLATLNQYFFVKIFKEKRPTGAWILYGATSLLGIYTHYFFSLVFLAQAVFFLLHIHKFAKHSFKKFAFVGVLVLLSLLPWLLYVYRIGLIGSQSPLLPVPSTIDLFNTFSQFLLGFQTQYLNTLVLSLWPILLLFAFFSLKRNKSTSSLTYYFFLTVLLPIGSTFLLSILIKPVFVSRYLILSIPSLYICVVVFVRSFEITTQKVVAGVGSVVLIAMLALEIASPFTPVKENYQEVTEYINTHAAAQDKVIVSAPFTLYPIEYYYHSDAPLVTLPQWDQFAKGPIPQFSIDRLPKEVENVTNSSQNVWLLLSYDQGYEKDIQTYFDTHYQRVFVKIFSPGLTLYEYKIRYDTPLSKKPLSLAN